jgi:hypothetical protein
MRNANIGVAVGLTVLFVGTFLFRHSEGALQAVLLATFVAAFGTHQFLGERERRRSGRSQ